MRTFIRSVVVAVSLAAPCVHAQEPGDARAGRSYVQTYCTQCHAVGPNEGVSPHLEAPSFFELAKTPGMAGRAIAAALQTSHETMPNFVLGTSDRDDIVAYFISSRPRDR